MAMPASRIPAAPGARRPSSQAASVASRLPTKAAPASTSGCWSYPRTMAPTAPTAPPTETPTRPGSASGLRKSACMTAPATASAAPASMPNRMRGRRMSSSTPSQSRYSGWPAAEDVDTESDATPSKAGIASSGMRTAPLMAEPIAATSSSANSTSIAASSLGPHPPKRSLTRFDTPMPGGIMMRLPASVGWTSKGPGELKQGIGRLSWGHGPEGHGTVIGAMTAPGRIRWYPSLPRVQSGLCPLHGRPAHAGFPVPQRVPATDSTVYLPGSCA